jgi:hypothetical protein
MLGIYLCLHPSCITALVLYAFTAEVWDEGAGLTAALLMALGMLVYFFTVECSLIFV